MENTTTEVKKPDVTYHEVLRSDLPLACPMPKIPLWNSHPKVYLPIEKTGKVSCPYCGTRYALKGFSE